MIIGVAVVTQPGRFEEQGVTGCMIAIGITEEGGRAAQARMPSWLLRLKHMFHIERRLLVNTTISELVCILQLERTFRGLALAVRASLLHPTTVPTTATRTRDVATYITEYHGSCMFRLLLAPPRRVV